MIFIMGARGKAFFVVKTEDRIDYEIQIALSQFSSACAVIGQRNNYCLTPRQVAQTVKESRLFNSGPLRSVNVSEREVSSMGHQLIRLCEAGLLTEAENGKFTYTPRGLEVGWSENQLLRWNFWHSWTSNEDLGDAKPTIPGLQTVRLVFPGKQTAGHPLSKQDEDQFDKPVALNRYPICRL